MGAIRHRDSGSDQGSQGSFIIDELADLVEEAVYQEFERISERGGVAWQHFRGAAENTRRFFRLPEPQP